MKTHFIIISLLMITIVIGCTKKSINDFEPTITDPALSEPENNAYPSVYYIDNIMADEETFQLQKSKNEDFYILITVKYDAANQMTTLQHNGYTTVEGYIEYGKNNNLKLKEELEFANHMRAYAEETGAIEEYEKTGKISESYLAYQEAYYQKVFNQAPNKIAFVLWDNYMSGDNVGVPYFWMLATLGYMNNRTTCVFNSGTGGAMTLFNKTFYRDRLITYPFFPFGWWTLTGDDNNAAESVITF